MPHICLLCSFPLYCWHAGFPLNCKLGRLVEILSPAERNEIKRVRQESRAASHPELTCHAHSGKPMDFYCENCKMLVCFQCTMSEHRQHEAVCYAKEALPHHIEVLSSCLSTAKSAASQANTTSMQLREKTKEVQRQSGQKAGAIQDFFLRARQLLSEREQELVGVVRREQQEKEDWLARRQQDVQRNLEDIRKDVKVGVAGTVGGARGASLSMYSTSCCISTVITLCAFLSMCSNSLHLHTCSLSVFGNTFDPHMH